jgi:hypothetical protein
MMPTPAVAAVLALAVSTGALFEREVTAAARLRFAGLAAELSPFAADATAIGAGTHIATASAQRQWVRRQWVRLRRAPIIAAAAAAATTLTATGFAPGTERRTAPG